MFAVSTASAQLYDIHKRQIAPEFMPVFEFFKALGNQQPENSTEIVWHTLMHPLDVPRLMSFIAAEGIQMSDVNWNNGAPWHLQRKTLERGLTSRKGPIHHRYKELAITASLPYRQYSELTFTRQGDNVIVNVANWYRLTFQTAGSHAVLKRLDYIMLEEDC